MPKQSRTADVNRVLASIIAAWPSLYKNRHDALLFMFTNSAIYGWENGCPVLADVGKDDLTVEGIRDQIKKLMPSDRLTNEAHGFAILRIKRENNSRRFTRAHAQQIAGAADYKPMFVGVPSFSTFNVNRIPLVEPEIAPQWKAALIELCKAICEVRADDIKKCAEREGYAAAYVNDQLVRLREAQDAAREAMIRVCPEQVPDPDRSARNERLDHLRYAAEALGYKLIPKESPT